MLNACLSSHLCLLISIGVSLPGLPRVDLSSQGWGAEATVSSWSCPVPSQSMDLIIVWRSAVQDQVPPQTTPELTCSQFTRNDDCLNCLHPGVQGHLDVPVSLYCPAYAPASVLATSPFWELSRAWHTPAWTVLSSAHHLSQPRLGGSQHSFDPLGKAK